MVHISPSPEPVVPELPEVALEELLLAEELEPVLEVAADVLRDEAEADEPEEADVPEAPELPELVDVAVLPEGAGEHATTNPTSTNQGVKGTRMRSILESFRPTPTLGASSPIIASSHNFNCEGAWSLK